MPRFAISIASLCALVVLVSACASPPQAPTATPTLAPLNASPVATWTPAIRATLPPTWTPRVAPALEPSPEGTQETVFITDPLLGVSDEPPLNITLPEGWQRGYDTLMYQDVFNNPTDFTYIPIALYRGPVTGGTGEIVLLWQFVSVTTGIERDPDFNQPNMWMDGLRLLHLLVMPEECITTTGPERDTYRIGDLPAAGTDFTTVNCGVAPDVRGWFAGVRVEGLNFVFYVYTDPADAINGAARTELQAILDSVTFNVDEFTPERTPEMTAEPE